MRGSALFGTDIADYWFPVSQGGDIAFLCGVLKILLENGWTNESFIDEAHGRFRGTATRNSCRWNWPVIEAASRPARASMQEFAELIRDAKNAVLVWSMGITQHRVRRRCGVR